VIPDYIGRNVIGESPVSSINVFQFQAGESAKALRNRSVASSIFGRIASRDGYAGQQPYGKESY